jgi:hypothetical protein
MATGTTATATAVARRLLDAIVTRDFDLISVILAPDARMRALLPRDIVQTDSAEAAVERFRDWFGTHDSCAVIATEQHTVEEREFVSYTLRVRPDWAPDVFHIVEQSGYCRVADDRVTRLDLVCTGYFPDNGASGRRTT